MIAHTPCTYRSRVWVREERDMSHHLVIGPLVLLCELDHFIQRQHTVAHLANRSRERGRDKKRVREKEEKEEEGRERGLYTGQLH